MGRRTKRNVTIINKCPLTSYNDKIQYNNIIKDLRSIIDPSSQVGGDSSPLQKRFQRRLVNPVNNHLVNYYATQINKYSHKTTLPLLPLILFTVQYIKNLR